MAESDPVASPAAAPTSAEGETVPGRRRGWWKIVAGVVALAGLLVAARQLGGVVSEGAKRIEQLGPWAPVVFVLGYAVAALALLPGSVLTLAGGALFGLLRGTLYVFAGATLGASGAFLVARYLARGLVERRLRGEARFAAVDRAIARQGRKIVFLLRLSPIFPFSLLNYALGLTRVRFADFLVASLGMLPGTLLYVYGGKVIGDVAAIAAGARPPAGPGTWAVLGLGLAATAVVTAVITRTARKALREEIEHAGA